MAKKWKDLKNTLSPKRRETIDKVVEHELAMMPLHKIRAARKLTQEELANVLGIKQSAVSKVESQTDMLISTLRKFIEAAGGELELVATFPEGTYTIDQFSPIIPRGVRRETISSGGGFLKRLDDDPPLVEPVKRQA